MTESNESLTKSTSSELAVGLGCIGQRALLTTVIQPLYFAAAAEHKNLSITTGEHELTTHGTLARSVTRDCVGVVTR